MTYADPAPGVFARDQDCQHQVEKLVADARVKLVGRWVVVPKGTWGFRYNRVARIAGMIWSGTPFNTRHGGLSVLLDIRRLDGLGFIVSDRARAYYPLRVLGRTFAAEEEAAAHLYVHGEAQ